jgi:cobalt-precorrin-7 (C5)-methyltransferase
MITPEAMAAIEGARVLVGGKRHLEEFARPGQEMYVLANNLEEIAAIIEKRRDNGVAVLATGDPGLYGILNFMRKRWQRGDIEVIPGVSSVQLAFARLSLPWHDAVILSAHGRSTEGLADAVARGKKTAVLTGSDNPPEKLYRLLEGSAPASTYYFCFDLSMSSEDILALRSGDAYPQEYMGRHNCIMVVLND